MFDHTLAVRPRLRVHRRRGEEPDRDIGSAGAQMENGGAAVGRHEPKYRRDLRLSFTDEPQNGEERAPHVLTQYISRLSSGLLGIIAVRACPPSHLTSGCSF